MTAQSLFKTPPTRKPYTPTDSYMKQVVNKSPIEPFMSEPNLSKRALLRCELIKCRATVRALMIVRNLRK